ncbi:N-acetylmuramoyl-L-alanine amidase [Aureibaculum algae]|uniref:N-acetylmuramoyl-L-alanine amidase n=1 Tax=Aureibaculum algae TaxID=2584122 RepID=A0A5B7TW06_9FLAO|nr:N-acetylmuramoyl-L-alanine amidase [Aureibaculum algae]QCX39494.1 N-acetylmuramoyl-L-alanine amidase [Aureibaculum algae]
MNTPLFKATIKKFFLLSFTFFLILQANTVSAQKKFKVVIDAGHGGTDPGNLGNGYFEKDIVLKIALEVGKLLKSDESFEVIYTRDDDTFIELNQRGKIAQKSKADLFVSIHCDAFGKSSAYGAGTFVLGLHENDRNFEIAKKENSVILLEDNYKENYDGFDPNAPESVIGLTLMQEEFLDQSLALASLIQNNFTGDLKRKDRLVKQAGFLVLRNTFMPSVLVETGFLTNKAEGAYLNSKKGQQEMATSIFKAIKSYKKQIDANTVVEVKPKEKPKVDTTPKTRIVKGVDFKVQISSSTKKVATASYNFKGLKGIERVRVGAHHKYYYGLTSDYNKAVALRTEAKAKGYKGAFIVAFKNEKKISVKDALALK